MVRSEPVGTLENESLVTGTPCSVYNEGSFGWAPKSLEVVTVEVTE